jgi:hypothetical protein
MLKALLDRLGVGVDVKFVLYQFTRNSRHVRRLPCKDVPIVLEEFDEHQFLFRIQIVPHVSDNRGLIHGEWDCLAELFLRLEGQLGSLGLMHDRVRGDSAKAFFNCWSFADANSMSTISELSLSQS